MPETQTPWKLLWDSGPWQCGSPVGYRPPFQNSPGRPAPGPPPGPCKFQKVPAPCPGRGQSPEPDCTHCGGTQTPWDTILHPRNPGGSGGVSHHPHPSRNNPASAPASHNGGNRSPPSGDNSGSGMPAFRHRSGRQQSHSPGQAMHWYADQPPQTPAAGDPPPRSS